MAIISRISRLFVSDMHALLERMEEPELVLRQSIRDMEEALQGQQLRLQRGDVQLRRLRRRLDDLASRTRDLGEQLDASITAGRMDTARGIVRRKLETQAQDEFLSGQMAELDEQMTDLREAIARRGAELEGLREKAQLLGDSAHTGDVDCGVPDPAPRINEQDVEAELLREIERRSAS